MHIDTADKYRELFRLRAEGRIPPDRSAVELVSLLKPLYTEGMHILDMCCASGYYYRYLKELGDINYYGIDLDPKMIDIAKTVFAGDTKAVFWEGDIYEPIGHNVYDVVFCYNTIRHLHQYRLALLNMYSATKKYLIIRSVFGNEEKLEYTKALVGYEDLYWDEAAPYRGSVPYNTISVWDVLGLLKHSEDKHYTYKFIPDFPGGKPFMQPMHIAGRYILLIEKGGDDAR